MQSSSIYKLLFFLNLLSQKSYTKKEIIEEFKKNKLSISKTQISNYVKTLINNEIPIDYEVNEKRERLYYFKKPDFTLTFTRKELNVISDVKKLLFLQKNYNHIRKTIRMFYKLALHIEDKEVQAEFINFGYYSSINWSLVLRLEKHCKQKDIIKIDYILPKGGNKYITIHVDEMKIAENSQRLYLHGVLENDKQFSFLPVDRIYRVKKVIREKVCFDLEVEWMNYVAGRKAYDELRPDKREKVTYIDDEKVLVERPVDNDFLIVQKLLYLCPEVYEISDKKIRELFTEKLEMMRMNYERIIDR